MANPNISRKSKKLPRTASEAAERRPRSPQRASVGRLREADLVIVTGMSGSGKGSVLKAFEDLGYYCVDNLPVDLIPKFAGLYRNSQGTSRAALVVDVREGAALKRFPAIYRRLRQQIRASLIFLLASDDALLRRFSETRRPHPLGSNLPLRETIAAERKALQVIRNAADLVIDTSQFNVHDLRNLIFDHFSGGTDRRTMLISCVSFGYRYGVPTDSDLVFDVRFLPNPNYISKFHHLSGRHPAVVKYIRSFPQTEEFTKRISDLLAYLIPHYIGEGKSYLTIGFGCTGGRHRSVMMAETIAKTLSERGFRTKVLHRDVGK
ncbi:MAG: RNase adapter RapZ [Acidobacteria bacterium]|nr:RNase adapter RapZ [Acidobacteriota bacterium]